jgi:tetratricopeptide (TPR) repeat protein
MKRGGPRTPAPVAVAAPPISLGPGQPARHLTVADALRSAHDALARADFDTSAHIGAQLQRVPGAMRSALVVLLQTAVGLSRPDDALTLAERLLDIGVEAPGDVLAVVQGLQLANRPQQAVELLTATLQRRPREVRLLHARAEILGEIGEHLQAVAELRRLLKRDPRCFIAYRTLAMLDRLSDEQVAFLDRAAIPAAERSAAWSALAFEYRKRGEPDREFHYLDQAHAVLAVTDPWVPAEESEMADQLIAMMDRGYFEQRPAVVMDSGRRPIFIVGMPRSGSTLAEQILVSAEGVEAAGESALFPWLLFDLAQRRHAMAPWPDIALKLTSDDLVRLRRDYLGLINRVYTRAAVFVDKQLTNWKYLGLLRQILPEAVFVHTVRDPLDTCLSTYQQAFHVLGFSHNLEHLAQFHLDQARVMDHWKRLFPERIHTLEYERLVAQPEAEIRRLLEFCRIPWSDRALRFHETQRGVRTASVMQVRRPIYHESVQKWRAYEKHLAVARSILGV